MTVTVDPRTGEARVACSGCGYSNEGRLWMVDRWIADHPPIPRCVIIEFYSADSGGDPDDRLLDCPECGAVLDPESVIDLSSTWRDAETCPEHEDYENGCALCFREAVEGGMSWLVDEALPGITAVEMPSPGPLVAVFELSYAGDRLGVATYAQGEALRISDEIRERIAELRAAAEQSVGFWDEQIERARRFENTYEEHKALRYRGYAGARLDRISNWRGDI